MNGVKSLPTRPIGFLRSSGSQASHGLYLLSSGLTLVLQPASSPLVCDDSFILVFLKLPHTCLSFVFAWWPYLLHWKKIFRWKRWPVHHQVCSRSTCPVSFSSLDLCEGILTLPVRDWSLLFCSSPWCFSPLLSFPHQSLLSHCASLPQSQASWHLYFKANTLFGYPVPIQHAISW